LQRFGSKSAQFRIFNNSIDDSVNAITLTQNLSMNGCPKWNRDISSVSWIPENRIEVIAPGIQVRVVERWGASENTVEVEGIGLY
jgi:hypothetical protein